MRSVRVVAIFSIALAAALVSGGSAGAADGEDVVVRGFSPLTVELGSIQDGPRILGGGDLSF